LRVDVGAQPLEVLNEPLDTTFLHRNNLAPD
jgi:hypothetical protein